MRFIWFNLMPWPDLPEDFREKYRSVWVDIPSALYDPVRGHEVYNTYLDQLEFAETVGYDGLGVNEHHANAYGLMPSPCLMAAALARRTSRAALVVLGSSIALYDPPIRVAEEFAMLDVISGGRLVAGFPVGTSMDTNYAYGRVPALLRERYAEAHELIRRAWAADEPFVFNGRYTKLRYANCWPKPIQKPYPPIWIPGGGSIETWDFCGRHAYQYSYLSFFGYRHGRRVTDGYWHALDRLGKEGNPYSLGFAQILAVADTDEEAEREYGPHVDYFFNRCLHVWSGFAEAPGYRTLDSIKSGFLGQVGKQTTGFDAGGKKTWKDLVEQGYIIAGSPKTVRDRLTEAVKTLRCGHLMCLMQIGSMPAPLVRKSTELFAREVMPHVRGLWSEYEDRWSPHPLPAAERARPASLAPETER